MILQLSGLQFGILLRKFVVWPFGSTYTASYTVLRIYYNSQYMWRIAFVFFFLCFSSFFG